MQTKLILILANSVKKRGRCVAGREIIDKGKHYEIGGWVRPISGHGEGELDDSERMLANRNRDVRIMDFVEMQLTRPADDPFQPENWCLDGRRAWRSVNGLYQRPSYKLLEESPRHLWHEDGNRSDRISHARLVSEPPASSLYIIRPTRFRIHLFTDGWKKRKRQAHFTYKGRAYELPMTDPDFEERHDLTIPAYGRPAVDYVPECGDGCFLCVSLAGDFQGHHYKIVATVFENC